MTATLRTALAACIALAPLAPLMADSQAPLAAAQASTERPEADRARDDDRKPAEVMAFAGVMPGMKVIELAPGGGYYTRLLSLALGSGGRLYPRGPRISPLVEEWARAHANTMPAADTPEVALAPEPVDMVWTTLNYHDFKNYKAGDSDLAAVVNKRVFAALKPGGVYLINDHTAAAGAGPGVTASLHRIEKATVIREVEAAGFTLEAESAALAHPADDHTLKVLETGIRGKTDQFILRFRKPRA